MTLNLTAPEGPGPWPLVVALHGWKAAAYQPGQFFSPDRPLPCFFLAPHTEAGAWTEEADALTRVVHDLTLNPSVDPQRLYLIGFSMGGAGTYQVANAYQRRFGGGFAALVRVAGQTEAVLDPEVADRAAVWHHVGTWDSVPRVALARECFRTLRGVPHRRGTSVSVLRDRCGGYPRKTKVLIRDGREQARLSLYRGLAHDDGVPFADPQLLPWLFARSLAR